MRFYTMFFAGDFSMRHYVRFSQSKPQYAVEDIFVMCRLVIIHECA